MSRSFAKEKILLIGPDGQVGHALHELLTKHHIPFWQAGITLDHNKERNSFKLDLCDQEAIRTLLLELKPSIIINPAAYTAVDKAESEKTLATQINSIAPGTIAHLAKELGALLIHFSTDYVFDGTGTHQHLETEATGPLNHYGLSKLEGEKAITESGCHHIILRTSWVFSSIGQNFVKTMLRLGSEREELRIIDDQIGAPTSARFLAESVLTILDRYFAPNRGNTQLNGIYHLTCTGETSWYGFAQNIFSQARNQGISLRIKNLSPILTTEYPLPAIRPLNSRLKLDKIKQTFAITPPTWEHECLMVLKEIVAK